MRILGFVLLAVASWAQNIDSTIDVGAHKLHVLCMGTGSPTVVLEAGMGDTSAAWMPVQRRMASYTRVCSYDRAGLGDSTIGTKNRVSGEDYVKDLHALLVAEKVKQPYVMVGHSMGGILVRLFAAQYPAEVKGMVLVDSSHEGFAGRGGMIAMVMSPDGERLDVMQVMAAARNHRWTADIPLTVLARRRADDELPPQATPARKAEIQRMHEEEQKDLASRSPRGRIVWVQNTGHYIQRDASTLLVQSVEDVVMAVRQGNQR
jgi:pimeloyl-ACP methyl ester carboxylesterase